LDFCQHAGHGNISLIEKDGIICTSADGPDPPIIVPPVESSMGKTIFRLGFFRSDTLAFAGSAGGGEPCGDGAGLRLVNGGRLFVHAGGTGEMLLPG
jgi:hypothetical protein